jgi:hypothetical protein
VSEREQMRQSLIQRNRTQAKRIEQVLRDQAYWNDSHPHEEPIDVDHDGMLALTLAWLDQSYSELRDGVHPVSRPSPRLAQYMESME